MKSKMLLKLTAAVLAAAFITPCGGKISEETERLSETAAETGELTMPAVSASETEAAAETSAPETEAAPKKHVLADDYGLNDGNFPITDGSTSTIPLEGGLRAMLFDYPQLDAELDVMRTKTHTAFQRLLDGECDAVFSVPLSEEQERLASEKGVEIEMIPIALEGFVFVVNKDNPINSLTQDQIRRIYSGEITNWKEVGGNDAEILAYQRNNDSGSQNHMTVFMEDIPLMEPRIELVSAGMEGLIDSIAVYDNSIDAIGYSIFSYAAQMYGETMDIKFIAPDGIPASSATLEDKSYPLMSATYIMYRKDAPADSPVFKLIEFIASDEGVTAIRNAGYVPYN